MKRINSVVKLSFLFLLTMLVIFGCRTKEMESALIYINQQNDWDKAMEQLEKAVVVNPADIEAHTYIGEGYARQGEFEKMTEHLSTAKKLIGDAAGGPNAKMEEKIKYLIDKYWVECFNKGVKYVRDDKFDESATSFENCVKIDSKRIGAYKNLAYVAMKKEDYESAIKHYNDALKIDAKDLESLFAVGNLYTNLKKFDKTIETMDLILEIKPDTVEAIAQKAMAYDFLGESDKAFAAYEAALVTKPDDKDLIFNLGRLYFLKDDYENAIARFKKVLEIAPDDLESNLNTGNAYLSLAEDIMKKYRNMSDKELSKIPTKDFNAEKAKANDYYKMAIPYLEKAVELEPDRAVLWTNLAVAYVNAGFAEKGKEAFKKADDLSK